MSSVQVHHLCGSDGLVAYKHSNSTSRQTTVPYDMARKWLCPLRRERRVALSKSAPSPSCPSRSMLQQPEWSSRCGRCHRPSSPVPLHRSAASASSHAPSAAAAARSDSACAHENADAVLESDSVPNASATARVTLASSVESAVHKSGSTCRKAEALCNASSAAAALPAGPQLAVAAMSALATRSASAASKAVRALSTAD